MKQLNMLCTLLLCALASAGAGACAEAPVDLVVPNFDAERPACHVRIPVKAEKCVEQSCVFPVAKGATAEPVQLNLTCFPTSAPTGFENPESYVKIRTVRTKFAKGSISLIDDIATPAATRQQDLSFCLYGKRSNLCGNARTLKIKGKESPTVAQIIAMIKTMEWDESSDK